MDYLMGLKGKDFVMVCSDTSAVQQIITIKHDEEKLLQIDDHTVLALSGMQLCMQKSPVSWFISERGLPY